jgi:hypothetical protein
MPNDAKLGLVVGVGLVITFAVVFFRKVPEAAYPQPDGGSVAVPAPQGSTPLPRGHVHSADKPTSALPIGLGIALKNPLTKERGSLTNSIPSATGGVENPTMLDRSRLRTPAVLPSGTGAVSPDLPEGH